MPFCKNCGARLSRTKDKDICPVCGTKNPLEGALSDTDAVTKDIYLAQIKDKPYKPCSRMIAFLLSLICGWSGSAFFYLRFIKIGIVYAICNIAFVCGLSCILYFASQSGLLLSILLPIIIIYIVNLALAVFFMVKGNFKDGRGELVK